MWQLRHWLQFLQLRTRIHDNLCYLTIKSDTGQHSQFLRCFTVESSLFTHPTSHQVPLLHCRCAFNVDVWKYWFPESLFDLPSPLPCDHCTLLVFLFIFSCPEQLNRWLQYWQLRTWFHDNLCYLTINCDTGVHWLNSIRIILTMFSWSSYVTFQSSKIFVWLFELERSSQDLQEGLSSLGDDVFADQLCTTIFVQY